MVDAGWIGSEVPASPRQAGLEVTVLEPAQVPLERVLGLGMSGTLTVGGQNGRYPASCAHSARRRLWLLAAGKGQARADAHEM